MGREPELFQESCNMFWRINITFGLLSRLYVNLKQNP
jgi:hypothetical protein